MIDGDEFVINGHKIWTSMAMEANHLFALVRTDKTVKKQAGISFVMIDMNQPGVTVRPIRNIAGHEELCEVFLDNVRTPVENLVGQLNDGWQVAKALLGFERVWSGSPRQSMLALLRLEKVARLNGRINDPVFQDKLTQITFDVQDGASAYERIAQIMRTGGSFGSEVSVLKIWATETCQRVTELLLEASGDGAGQRATPLHGLPRLHDLWRLQPDPAQYSGEDRAEPAHLKRTNNYGILLHEHEHRHRP